MLTIPSNHSKNIVVNPETTIKKNVNTVSTVLQQMKVNPLRQKMPLDFVVHFEYHCLTSPNKNRVCAIMNPNNINDIINIQQLQFFCLQDPLLSIVFKTNDGKDGAKLHHSIDNSLYMWIRLLELSKLYPCINIWCLGAYHEHPASNFKRCFQSAYDTINLLRTIFYISFRSVHRFHVDVPNINFVNFHTFVSQCLDTTIKFAGVPSVLAAMILPASESLQLDLNRELASKTFIHLRPTNYFERTLSTHSLSTAKTILNRIKTEQISNVQATKYIPMCKLHFPDVTRRCFSFFCKQTLTKANVLYAWSLWIYMVDKHKECAKMHVWWTFIDNACVRKELFQDTVLSLSDDVKQNLYKYLEIRNHKMYCTLQASPRELSVVDMKMTLRLLRHKNVLQTWLVWVAKATHPIVLALCGYSRQKDILIYHSLLCYLCKTDMAGWKTQTITSMQRKNIDKTITCADNISEMRDSACNVTTISNVLHSKVIVKPCALCIPKLIWKFM